MRFRFRELSAIALVPILLLVRLVRRIIKVELCVVGAQRFGHLALEPEVFLNLQRIQGTHSSHRVVTLWSFGRAKIQSNKKLASLWRLEVGPSPSRLVGALIRAGEYCPPLALHRVSLSVHGPLNVLDVTPSRLAIRTRSLSSEILQQLGLKPGEFVCLVIRDSSYYMHTGTIETSGYHLLNFQANEFVDACSRLVTRGFKVVRLGTPTPNSLGRIDGVIDYANSSARSEVNDLILVRDCAFLLSTQTGPDALGLALRKPVLYIDTVRLSQFFFGTKLATWNPVDFIDPRTTQPLSLRELLNSPFNWMKSPDEFLRSGYVFKRSSSSDVAEMVSSYVEELRNGASGELLALRRDVNRQMTEAFGERGQSRWGNVAANLNGWWLTNNSDWFLR
jgi:putative glycosyltransferase (TIGR04372 family)